MDERTSKDAEQKLIADILRGDVELYANLIDRHKEALYRHCLKFVRDTDDAADIAQDSFIQAYVNLEFFDGKYRFSTWLYTIATRKSIDFLRRKKTVPMADDELSRIVGTLPSSDTIMRHNEMLEAIDKLPLNQKQVIELYYWEGKTYEEIASHMQRPTGSVKGWLARAKKQLKEVLS